MSWIMFVYLTVLLLLIAYLLIIIVRILPLIIYVHQPLPFVPIPKRMAKTIAKLSALQSAKTIVDLGCGTGTLLAELHRYLPQASLTGVEYKPSLLRWAKWRTHFSKPQPTLVCTDMFQYDVSKFDGIVGFWIPRLTQQLVNKFADECKSGCIIVSYLFPLPSHPSLQLHRTENEKQKIFVYRKI